MHVPTAHMCTHACAHTHVIPTCVSVHGHAQVCVCVCTCLHICISACVCGLLPQGHSCVSPAHEERQPWGSGPSPSASLSWGGPGVERGTESRYLQEKGVVRWEEKNEPASRGLALGKRRSRCFGERLEGAQSLSSGTLAGWDFGVT